MKRFDLTFKGEILPDYDPRQVKASFAELFRIKDPQILEELFSGDRIVLRANLDRKSAAEYFHKVSQLGGKAELVTSSSPDDDTSVTMALQTPARRADPVETTPRPARTHQVRKPAATPKPKEILSRIRKLQEQARAEHADELDLIDRQQSAEENKTARGLADLREEHDQSLEKSLSEIQRLDELEESVLHQFQLNHEVILEETEGKKSKLETQLSRIEDDIFRCQSNTSRTEQELESKRQATREIAELAIAKLEAQIVETREQAERDIAELVKLSAENEAHQQEELTALKQKSESLAETSARDLMSLDLRLEEYQQQKDAELEEIRYLKSQAEHSRDNELSAIAAREQELYQLEKRHLEELKRARERQNAALEQKLERLRQEERRLARGAALPD